MEQMTLCLAFHNHQPVGNFSWVFADAFRQAYLPLVDALERHPTIRVSLHYTGPLFDWFRANEPGFLRRVAALVARGQVEIMTGGYYEPILPAVPTTDQLGQIAKMTEYVRSELGAEPTGLWLAERVWEPHLPSLLRRAGVDWTIVDDTHFKMSGLSDADLHGYYVTEDEGEPIKVFASSKRLRYIIPWAPVEQVMAELREAASDDPHLAWIMGDDGEKFGIWPSTYEHCWTKGWMERFFKGIEANASWLKVIPVGEYAANHPARGRIYLPTASYAEMMEWALPSAVSEEFSAISHALEAEHRDDITRFLRGGFWRNFLVKYDEVNTMHKKMLRAHHKVYQTAPVDGRPDRAALDDLWKGQCNCPYWHGVFGGVYMTDVRSAAFHHLIRAEARADQLIHRTENWMTHERSDFDCDSRAEILIDSPVASYIIASEVGGSLIEWDLRSIAHNLLSVLTRRPEAYHAALRRAASQKDEGSDEVKTIHDLVRLKEPGLDKLLTYDRYRKAGLIDHFLAAGTTPAAFAAARYDEVGDFLTQPYQARIREDGPRREVTLSRDGHLNGKVPHQAVSVTKTLTFTAADPGFSAAYRVFNRSDHPLETTFGIEFSLNLLGGGSNPLAYCCTTGAETIEGRFDAPWHAASVTQVNAGNQALGIETSLSVSQPATAWWSSIDSVSSSEGGFERVHQGSTLLFSWPLALPPGTDWQVTIRADVGEARPDGGS